MKMHRGIAVGGNLVADYVKLVDSYPKEGNLSTILDISQSVGGAVPNVLINLAKMAPDIPLEAIGMVGQDEAGDYLLDMLKKYNIETKLIYREPSSGTSFTDVMTVKSTGIRTFFHYRGANQRLAPEHFDYSKINSSILHIGYALLLDTLDAPDPQYGTGMARTLAMAQEHGIKTSIDVVSENSNRFSKIVPHSLKYTDYCIINEVEASLTTQIPVRTDEGDLIIENLAKICKRLFEMGVKEWVVIHAPEGGFAQAEGGEFKVQPSLKLPDGYIKGTVGAGDAFCAGVLYCIYKGLSIDKALQIGVAAAACNLSAVNSIDGMKNIADVEHLFNTTPKRCL